jgi:cell wall-associated NlpC family hydrolase
MRPRPEFLSGRLRQVWCATGLALLSSIATATPNAEADPIVELLMSKGLGPVTPAAGAGPAFSPMAPGAEASRLQRVRERAADMVLTALAFVGVRYQLGGDSHADGFDCSGFTRHVFGSSLGLQLPRRAEEQARAAGLVEVGREELQPGDLVFFNTMRRTFSHVGIYIGDNRFVHAPRPGGEIRTESMDLAYWRQRFTGARRADAIEQAAWSSLPQETSPASR